MPFNIIMHVRVCNYLESAPGVLTRKYSVYIYIYIVAYLGILFGGGGVFKKFVWGQGEGGSGGGGPQASVSGGG